MKKFSIFLLCLSLLVLTSCGGGNEGDEEPGGGEAKGSECTTSKPIGLNPLTEDLSYQELHNSCITEMINVLHPGCSWQKDEEKARKRIDEIKDLQIVFGDECKDPDTDEKMECPDFIPPALYISYFEGCEVYSIDPDSNCIAPCADLYFSADDLRGHTRIVYVGADSDEKNYIKGDDGTISFASDFNLGNKNKAVFSWSEKAEDGSETIKRVTLSAKVEKTPKDDDIIEECFWTRCSH